MANLRLDRDKLKRRREIKGYNVPALADILGITPDHMYRLERGVRHPSPALYVRMANALEVDPPEELLLDESEATAGHTDDLVTIPAQRSDEEGAA